MDRNNELSFAEFVDFLLTVSAGTRDDKLEFGFRLMDLDKNGVITRVRGPSAEVVAVIVCVCVWGGGNVARPRDGECAATHHHHTS